jgi:hypothetical protein
MVKHRDELPDALSDGDLRAEIFSESAGRAKQALHQLLSRKLPDKRELLRSVLENASAAPQNRMLALSGLGKNPEDETLLIRILRTSTDTNLRRRLMQTLGAVGSENALEVLSELKADYATPEGRALYFSRTLLSARLGLRDHPMPIPAAAARAPISTSAVSLEAKALPESQLLALRKKIGSTHPEIRYSNQIGHELNCENNQLAILYNSELQNPSFAANLQYRQAVIAVVFKYDHCGASWYASEYVLAQPDETHTHVDLIGVRPSGHLIHVGSISAVAGGWNVDLHALVSPYTNRLELNAVMSSENLQVNFTTLVVDNTIEPLTPRKVL